MRKNRFLLRPKKRMVGFCWYVIYLLRSVAAFLLGGDMCVRCGKASGVYPLCPSCLSLFMESNPPFSVESELKRCRICGKVLVSEIEICSSCREKPVLKSTERNYPLHSYRLWKKSVLFAWKTENKRTLSPVFAQMVYGAYEKVCAETGKNLPVVPVPPRPGKIKNRGWDQVDEMCRFLHTGWNVPVLKILCRKSRVQQKKLGRLRRLDRAEKSYHLVGKKVLRRLAPVPPKSVVLIDDVLTTGATFEACASKLRSFGVQKVYGITLFVVD